MKIAILGFGTEGQAALKFLRAERRYCDAEFVVLDRKNDPDYLAGLVDFDLVVKSPGVPFRLPEIRQALKAGTFFSSITDIFFRHAKGLVIGVTGTKGKGTTSTLIYKILKAAHKDVHLAGNIGNPATEILKKLTTRSISVIELSSFQLQNLKHSPDIAVVLDIFPDHMDAHENFKEYVDAKANIAKWQKKSGKIFFFADDRYSRAIAMRSPAKKYPVSLTAGKMPKILSGLTLKIPGRHNLKNALMAAEVTSSLSVRPEIVRKVIAKFTGLEHRLELVRTFNFSERQTAFYNDSGSTNPQTSAAAIRAFKGPKILIAGGKDKNLDYRPLMVALKGSHTLSVVLFGENKQKIARAIRPAKVPLVFEPDLRGVIRRSLAIAKKQKTDVAVLFSPGSTSFDMFPNYKERGKIFKKTVKNWK